MTDQVEKEVSRYFQQWLPAEDKGLYARDPYLALAKMRDLYVQTHVPLKVLCGWYLIGYSVLSKRAQDDKWSQHRAEYTTFLFNEYKRSKKSYDSADAFYLLKAKASAVQILLKHLEQIEQNAEELTLAELERIANIHEKICKHFDSVERKAPSEVLTAQNMSPEEYTAALKALVDTDSAVLEKPDGKPDETTH